MPVKRSEILRPKLEEAKKVLEKALEEACEEEVHDADIAKLIRIEESLAIAGVAAKEAISVGQRLKEQATAPEVKEEIGAVASRTHRLFEDATGVRWDAFAVYPSSATAGHQALPDPYQRGWLSFSSGKVRRRLAPIPDGWKDLSDDGLCRLCEKAAAAPRVTSAESPPKTDVPPD